MDSTNHESCSTAVPINTIEKHLSMREPAQFKPILLKGQVYLKQYTWERKFKQFC